MNDSSFSLARRIRAGGTLNRSAGEVERDLSVIPSPDKALAIAQSRTRTPLIGAVQLLSWSPLRFALPAFVLGVVASSLPSHGLVVAATGMPLLLVILVKAEYSVVLARTANGHLELIQRDLFTGRISTQVLDTASVTVLMDSLQGFQFRTLAISNKTYRVRANFDPELRNISSLIRAANS